MLVICLITLEFVINTFLGDTLCISLASYSNNLFTFYVLISIELYTKLHRFSKIYDFWY